jgi:hypothetical protein
MILSRRDDGSLEISDLLLVDNNQNLLLKEIANVKLTKTQFKERFGGVHKKFGLAEKALVEKLEQYSKEGLLNIPVRGVMLLTESGIRAAAS